MNHHVKVLDTELANKQLETAEILQVTANHPACVVLANTSLTSKVGQIEILGLNILHPGFKMFLENSHVQINDYGTTKPLTLVTRTVVIIPQQLIAWLASIEPEKCIKFSFVKNVQLPFHYLHDYCVAGKSINFTLNTCHFLNSFFLVRNGDIIIYDKNIKEYSEQLTQVGFTITELSINVAGREEKILMMYCQKAISLDMLSLNISPQLLYLRTLHREKQLTICPSLPAERHEDCYHHDETAALEASHQEPKKNSL